MYLPVAALNAGPFGILPVLLSLGGTTAALCVMRAMRRHARRRVAEHSSIPVLRRADAHPDAPPRAPLLAMRDLGVPFLDEAGEGPEQMLRIGKADPLPGDFQPISEPVERALPRDHSQLLAVFDPGAIPSVPLARPTRIAPLRPRVAAAGQAAAARLRSALHDDRIARPETDATVHALLDRLERGVMHHGLAVGLDISPHASARRRGDRELENALVTLRNLARSA